MIRRIFNTLSLISAILLASTAILWAWSFWTDPRKDCLSFSGEFHVAVQDGRVSFFSDKEYGPYRGSISALTSPAWPIERIFSKQRAFGDTLGIYYRYFRWADSGAVLWTLSVSLFYPMIAFAVLPTIWLWTWRRRVRSSLRAIREMFGPRQEMFSVIRLYWWMGVVGAVVYFVTACTIILRIVLCFESPSLDNVGPLAICCVWAAVFGASLHVAHRLRTKPEGMLPYARMIGIILATAWFPILTIPGIICVRRVTKHFAAHCESVRSRTGTQSKGAL
jgi:hypothetical protein